MLPPLRISGRQAVASDLYEYVETCSALDTSAQPALRNSPPSTDCGPNAIECTMPSRPSTCSRTRSGSDARCSSSVTSSSITGAFPGSRLAIRSTRDIRPKPVSTTSAPFSWATLATEKAIEASVMTPVTSSRLPANNPDTELRSLLRNFFLPGFSAPSAGPGGGQELVPHAEAAVDRDHRAVDVRGGVRRQERHRGRHLIRPGQSTG